MRPKLQSHMCDSKKIGVISGSGQFRQGSGLEGVTPRA